MSEYYSSHDDTLGVSPGQIVLDRYELFEPCGFGGTASVWRAWVLGTQHEVAIKIQTLGPRTGAHRPERLEREYHILQKMSSPYVVAVNDFGYLPDGRAVLVFEYLQGETLGDMLEETPTLELREALEITAQILRALVEVHTIGVVHRDIKPENVMLLKHGEEGRRLKLFDFGIAKVLERDSSLAQAYDGDELAGLFRSLTSAEMTVGTPEYMAPEQISATALGPFTDVYAVGIVLHEILFGEVPYTGDTFFEIAHRHLSGVLPPLPANLPSVIHQLLWTALARRYEERYQDAGQMLQAVEAAMVHPEVVLYQEDASLDIHNMDDLDIVALGGSMAQDTPAELRALAEASRDDYAPWGTQVNYEGFSPAQAPGHGQDPLHSLPAIDLPPAPPAPPWEAEADGVKSMMSKPLARSSTPLSAALAQAALRRKDRHRDTRLLETEAALAEAARLEREKQERASAALAKAEHEARRRRQREKEEEEEGGAWGRQGTSRWGPNFLDKA